MIVKMVRALRRERSFQDFFSSADMPETPYAWTSCPSIISTLWRAFAARAGLWVT